MEFRAEGEDATEEETLALQDEKHYEDVRGIIIQSLQLIDDYEESFKIYKAALPNPEHEKKVLEEKNVKETLAKQLEQEEALQKKEAEAAAKADEDKIMKELRSQVIK